MREIETKISPLMASLFPSFYQEDGENFIMFVKAYFEWLEQNHQLISLEDNTNFNVGDTLQQENVTGTIIAFVENDILVRVNELETFKCFNVCSELLPVTSSSGGSTYILRGGTTRRLGTIFLSRNLTKIRDIDKTLDLFIVRFKEKYLKNIEFDVQTNKQLLIKNSLDLYRSKGTDRSVDLFFRLIYGVNATVYNPGDDIMRLSDGEWVKPRYIEISSTSPERAIALVGKQIRGASSGATAFVEKYIRRKIKNGFVDVLYISNVGGRFINRELLISDQVFIDSPTVVGSLTFVEIVSGSRGFNVGDLVSFNSTKGDYGIARVASITNKTGIVDFIFIEGGFGYTDSANTSYTAGELKKRTQSLVSEKVLTLTDVRTSNIIDTITVSSGGSGYLNTDTVFVVSPFANATGKITTNGSGSVENITITNTGSGFYVLNPSVSIVNSTGGSTTGIGASLVATTKEQSKYFQYFEPLNQVIVEVEYDTAANNQLFTVGDTVYVGNSSVNNAFGTILTNANNTLVNANGIITLAIANNGLVGTSNTITLTSNTSVTANVAAVTDVSPKSTVMGVPNTAIIALTGLTGTITRAQEVYQLDSNGIETGNAIVVTTSLNNVTGSISVDNLKGVIRQGRQLYVRDSAASGTVSLLELTVGVYNITGNNFTNTYSTPMYTTMTGTTANVISVSTGSGASFRVGAVGETEIIYLNTDALASNNQPTIGANQAFMTVPISAVEYGFPKNPVGNSSSIIYSCLNFDSFEIGVIDSITSINPGADYNVDPYVLAYQPYISGFNKRDYVIQVANNTGQFVVGERIEQSDITITKYDLVVSDETGYTIGEKVYQGTIGSETATGIIDAITVSANTIKVADVTGTFTATTLKSYITPALAATVSTITLAAESVTAKGIIKEDSTSSSLLVKRIQFNDFFQEESTITGAASGATAKIVKIYEDANTLQIGINAIIEGNVVTSNGSVTSLQVVDSGLGYSNGEVILYTSQDGERSGEAKAIVYGSGTGSGYYRASKGFLSSLSKIHDGDYYQEYSYEILTRIPLDKYAEMFKKVMHTAGTRFFGSVLIEDKETANASIAETALNTSLAELVQFNSNTDIISNAIVFDNDYANTVLKFTDGQKITYTTAASNTVIIPLANNVSYYVANANSTSIKLVTNPRTLTKSFNANTSVQNAYNFILLDRHSFANNDVLKYVTAAGNTAITGLTNNSIYHVVAANTAGVKLASTRGGSPVLITASTTSENGHQLSITTINIVANTTASGTATSGHFITHVNEI